MKASRQLSGATLKGASWQRCQARFCRNATGKAAYADRKALSADIASVFAETTLASAMRRSREVADAWREKAPLVAAMPDTDIEQCLTALALPAGHQKRIRTTKGLKTLQRGDQAAYPCR